MKTCDAIRIVDLFAGPGGLGEGFSAYRAADGGHPFRIVLSVENDPAAHRTLTLRSFFRRFRHEGQPVPAAYYEHLQGRLPWGALELHHPTQWALASSEALLATLGSPEDQPEVTKRLQVVLEDDSGNHLVLIGGPPCQAYSVIGRSRNQGVEGYRPENDGRHFLYEEYLRILATVWPAVFVLENVKGILSSEVSGRPIFDKILQDLTDPAKALGARRGTTEDRPRYRLVPLFPPAASAAGESAMPEPERFVVRCEDHGVPQRRHRVILVGIREDMDTGIPSLLPAEPVESPPPSVRDMIAMLPPLRSRLSLDDSTSSWRSAVRGARTVRSGADSDIREAMAKVRRVLKRMAKSPQSPGAEWVRTVKDVSPIHQDPGWFIDERLDGVCNHAARSHMAADLHRYLYASCFARVHSSSPRLSQFPWGLLPEHKNVKEAVTGHGMFSDRFRVQCAGAPATTITAHMGKDGHYYIHPDPLQCRSLTVREAARLQTFPDNYFFEGPRSAQYRQVGNAVPPLLARRIAEGIHSLLAGPASGR